MPRNPGVPDFIQAVAFGMSYAQAYQKHISKGKCSDITANVNGSKLANETDIQLAIIEARKQVAEKAEKRFDLSKDKWLDRMMGIADKAEEAEDFAAAKGALAEVGKACDYYAAIKVEHEHSGTIEHTHSFDGVLKSIIDSGSPVTRRLEKAREREVEVIPLESAKKKK